VDSIGVGGTAPLRLEVGGVGVSGGCPTVLGGWGEDSKRLEPPLVAGGRRGRGLLCW
jgi:hypothetical protein